MKWWFLEKADIETALPAAEVMVKIKTIARPAHGILDTLNPDHQFNDNNKIYVGTIGDRDFRLKRKYVYVTSRGTGRTMGLVIRGQVEDDFRARVLHLSFSVPAINLLWFLFPPIWLVIGFAYIADSAFLHGIPVITLLAFLLFFYVYWLVLAQFRSKVRGAVADFEQALQKRNSFY